MTLLQSLFLGALQGVAEFLPVSSSGHLVVFRHFMDLGEVPALFDILLHLATLIVVLIVFRKTIGSLFVSLFRFARRKADERDKINLRLIWILILASIFTAVLGFIIESLDVAHKPRLVSVLFLVTAGILLGTRFLGKDGAGYEKAGVKTAVITGIALGTIFKIFSLLLPPIWGIAQGMQPFVGVNYGAGQMKRMMKGYKLFTGYATVFTLIFWSMLVFAPKIVLSWFIVDTSIQAEIFNAPRIFFCLYPVYGFMFNTLILLQATGSAKRAAIFVSFRMLLYFIPPMLMICPFFGALGVWMANPISDALTSLTAFFAIVSFQKKLKPDPVYV